MLKTTSTETQDQPANTATDASSTAAASVLPLVGPSIAPPRIDRQSGPADASAAAMDDDTPPALASVSAPPERAASASYREAAASGSYREAAAVGGRPLRDDPFGGPAPRRQGPSRDPAAADAEEPLPDLFRDFARSLNALKRTRATLRGAPEPEAGPSSGRHTVSEHFAAALSRAPLDETAPPSDAARAAGGPRLAADTRVEAATACVADDGPAIARLEAMLLALCERVERLEEAQRPSRFERASSIADAKAAAISTPGTPERPTQTMPGAGAPSARRGADSRRPGERAPRRLLPLD